MVKQNNKINLKNKVQGVNKVNAKTNNKVLNKQNQKTKIKSKELNSFITVYF